MAPSYPTIHVLGPFGLHGAGAKYPQKEKRRGYKKG